MDKKLENKIIWTLVFILILIGLTGCGIKPLKVLEKPIEEKITTLDTIGKMPTIVQALSCMFAPSDPSCQKNKKSSLTDEQLN